MIATGQPDDALFDVIDQIAVPMYVVAIAPGQEDAARLLHGNRAWEDATGLALATARGKTPADLFPRRMAKTILRNYAKCRTSGGALSYHELLDYRGSGRWWATTLSPLRNAEGQVTRLVGLSRDITADKTRQIQATEDLARLNRLNQELRIIAGVVASDVKGPLETVEAMLHLVLQDFVDLGNGKRDLITCALDVIDQFGDRLTHLLDHSLAPSPNPAPQPVDLGHVCADLAALLDPAGRLDIVLPNTTVAADPVGLHLIMRILLDQAVRRASQKILVRAEPGRGGRLILTVADDRPVSPTEIDPLLPDIPGPTGFADLRSLVETRGGHVTAHLGGPLHGGEIQVTLPPPDPVAPARQGPEPQQTLGQNAVA